MVSGLPWVKASSGRQSSTCRNWSRPPGCREATARASSSRSSIGIGGSATRVGRSPSQARSSRREVSSTWHRVWSARSRRKPASSCCSAGVQALSVPAGNPATGSMLSQIHSTGTCASSCSATSRRCPSSRVAHWIPAPSRAGPNWPPIWSSSRASGTCWVNGVNSTPAVPPVSAYQRANSSAVEVLPAPAQACSSTTRSRSKARSSASSVSSRPKNPASGPAGSPRSRPARSRPASAWSKLIEQAPAAGLWGQQGQRGGLVDHRHHPVLQRHRPPADLPLRVRGQLPPRRGHRAAERLPGQQRPRTPRR